MANDSCSFMDYVKASDPLLWVDSYEEQRVLAGYTAELRASASAGGPMQPYNVFTWDVAVGIRHITLEGGVFKVGEPLTYTDAMGATKRYTGVLDPLTWMEKGPAKDDKPGNPSGAPDNTVMFLKDYHPYLGKEFEGSAKVIRMIRNLISEGFKAKGKVLAILSPCMKIPPELEKAVKPVRYTLPDREGIRKILKMTCEDAGIKYPAADDEPIIEAALGMTADEAESSFACCIVKRHGKLNAKLIRQEKANVVKKSDILEIIETTQTLDEIGALEDLKEYLVQRKNSFSEEARAFGVSPTKGILIVGEAGNGKSATSKAISAAYNRPLIRMSMGKIFDKWQGETEAKLQRCLAMAESISPCILWIDELEKAFGGMGGESDNSGNGTASRVLGDFLYWMEERKSDVLVVATGNNVSSLPEALLRPGRMDVIFWVGRPDEVQRAEILNIHLKKNGRKDGLAMFKDYVEKLVEWSKDFSGAGLERWVKAAIEHAFFTGKKEVDVSDFEATKGDVTPADPNSPEMQKALKWALDHKCKMASKTHTKEEAKKELIKARKIGWSAN